VYYITESVVRYNHIIIDKAAIFSSCFLIVVLAILYDIEKKNRAASKDVQKYRTMSSLLLLV
jgi:hypothetical protein